VAIGGSTVFPKLGVTVPPAKGSIIFWHEFARPHEEVIYLGKNYFNCEF